MKHLIPTPQSLKTLSAKLHAGGQALRTGSRALNAARVRISTYLRFAWRFEGFFTHHNLAMRDFGLYQSGVEDKT